jgi:hypothetical protein
MQTTVRFADLVQAQVTNNYGGLRTQLLCSTHPALLIQTSQSLRKAASLNQGPAQVERAKSHLEVLVSEISLITDLAARISDAKAACVARGDNAVVSGGVPQLAIATRVVPAYGSATSISIEGQ